jgi:hypothetical protein
MATMQETLNSLSDASIRHVVPISGGKDSAALAVYMRTAYRQIPVEYIFCDSECELPETYAYLRRLETVLGKPIAKVSIYDVYGIGHKPGRNAFDYVLRERYGDFLPSPMARWCTRELKIRPFEKFIGAGQVFSYIGIRTDENRQGYVQGKKPPLLSTKPNIIPVYPFIDDGKTIEDITNILDGAGLGLPEYYKWRSRSGCYFCFYQQIGEWQGLKERHPDLFARAKAYEKNDGPRSFTWVAGKTLDTISAMPRKSITPLNETEGCAICHL